LYGSRSVRAAAEDSGARYNWRRLKKKARDQGRAPDSIRHRTTNCRVPAG
jgi:hypothetical protein